MSNEQSQTTKREIELEIIEAETLKCRSCDTIVEVAGYCRHCADYWEDVRNGLFDDYWREELKDAARI